MRLSVCIMFCTEMGKMAPEKWLYICIRWRLNVKIST